MRQIFSFNEGWKFCREKDAMKNDMRISNFFSMYSKKCKTGVARGLRSSCYFDADWQDVHLPHDWDAGAEFDLNSITAGFKPNEVVWYRKQFRIPAEYEGKHIKMKFDAIAIDSEIYFNNVLVERSFTGYTPITIDITDFVRYGKINTVAVRVFNGLQEGWWYEGGGIYRNAYIFVEDECRFEDDGVFVSAERTNGDNWTVRVRSEVTCDSGDMSGLKVAVTYDGATYTADAAAVTEQRFSVSNPPLWNVWNVGEPNLCSVTVKLLRGDEVMDSRDITFGFREVRFDASEGCFINGKPVKIAGVCLHDDHAGVGTAIPYKVHLYRMKRLKAMGCNGIRTSHNPYNPEFYRACDEVGMVVMDEIRQFSTTRDGLRDLRTFIRRDRNHPCVILWSMFNEEIHQCSREGEKIGRTMKALINEEDGTRLVTGGQNGSIEAEGIIHVADVMGFNYMQYGYDEFHAMYPDMPIIGSENASYISGRGEPEFVMEEGHAASYGKELYKSLFPWSSTPGENWRNIESRPFVAGGFYWTGFDYRGEVCKFGKHGTVSNFGAMDLCGFAKDAFCWNKVLWMPQPDIYVAPHWTYEEGQTANIICYTNCEEVELLVNGRSVLQFENDKYDPQPHAVPFEKGVLTAIGKNGGKEVCRREVATAGRAVKLVATLSEDKLIADGKDAVVVDLCAVDEKGTVVPDFSGLVSFEVSGSGKFIGAGNGDNASHECDKEPRRYMYHGMCQAIFQSDVKPGEMKLSITCDGLKGVEVTLPVEYSEGAAHIHSEPCHLFFSQWRISDVIDYYPSVEQILNDSFTWKPTMAGYGKNLFLCGKKGYCIIAGRYAIMPAEIGQRNMRLTFERIVGACDIYLQDKLIFSTDEYIDRRLDITIDKADAPLAQSISVGVVFKPDGRDCGLYEDVYVRFVGEDE